MLKNWALLWNRFLVGSNFSLNNFSRYCKLISLSSFPHWPHIISCFAFGPNAYMTSPLLYVGPWSLFPVLSVLLASFGMSGPDILISVSTTFSGLFLIGLLLCSKRSVFCTCSFQSSRLLFGWRLSDRIHWGYSCFLVLYFMTAPCYRLCKRIEVRRFE